MHITYKCWLAIAGAHAEFDSCHSSTWGYMLSVLPLNTKGSTIL